MAEKHMSLETWGGYYLRMAGAGKSWTADVIRGGTGVGPGGKVRKTVKGKSLDEARAAARKAADAMPRL